MKWNPDNSGRIEFRFFNSTLNSETVMQNLLLIGKVFEVSLENAKNPQYKGKEFFELLRHDLSEEGKLDVLLNLLFDEEKENKFLENDGNL